MGKRVLVVEDDAVVRLVVSHYLKGMGWEVQEAGSGTAAIVVLDESSKPIDLVLTDYHLPDFVGLELVSRVRKECPVVLMTGCSKEDANLSGHVLRKPFGEEALREMLAELESSGSL